MSRPPRILFVIGSLREGGAEGQLVYLMRGLRQRGWRVGLMLLHYEGVRLQQVIDEGFEVFPVNLRRFRPRWNALAWLSLPLAWWNSVRFVRRFRPDVLHAWLFWAHLWGRLIVPRRTVYITSRRQTFSDKRDSRLLTAVENWINRRAEAITCNSKAVGRACLKKEKHVRGKLRLVSNGIDFQRLDAMPRADLRSEFPVLADAQAIAATVANLMPHKGYDLLLESWKHVVSEFPGAKLLCIGSGPLQEELATAARALGLGRHVVFTGYRPDVPSLLKDADFAVHASRDEGFSNAILEYMACGKAIAATDVGGNREALAHGRAGLLVPPGDRRMLADAALKLARSPENREALGRRARRVARRRYPLEAMIDGHSRLYEEMWEG